MSDSDPATAGAPMYNSPPSPEDVARQAAMLLPSDGAVRAALPFPEVGATYSVPPSVGHPSDGGATFPQSDSSGPGVLEAKSPAGSSPVAADGKQNTSGSVPLPTGRPRTVPPAPPWTFVLEMGYLIVLLLLAYLVHYNLGGLSAPGFIRQFNASPSIGPIPIAIPWFGALGAVVRGLAASYGETEAPAFGSIEAYNKPLWHISRPLMGGALGIITYIVFLLMLLPAAGNNGPLARSEGPLVLAFLVGYSDGTFTTMIKRAVDVILGPGDTPSNSGPEAGGGPNAQHPPQG